MRSVYSTCFAIGFALVCNMAFANDEQFLKIATQKSVVLDSKPMMVSDLHFNMWVDPLKTNWIAWSLFSQAQTWERQPVIDKPLAGNIGAGDYVLLIVTAPDGSRSGEYKMDQNDDQGRSFGPQAVIFGKHHMTPNVARATPGGQASFFDEGGVSDKFFFDHGQGLYQFELKIYKAYSQTGSGTPNLWLLKNANEGYDVKPPIEGQPYGGLGMYWSGNNNDGDDDNDDGYSDIPGGGPFPDNPDEGEDIPGGGPFPHTPMIPEPATLVLAALGLGLMSRLRKK